MLSVSISILLAIDIIVSLLIIFVVLMQRPKSEGLGAAFGGGMTENLFGAQTSNVLANFTRWMAGIFFVVTLILSILYAKQSTKPSTIQQNLIKEATAAAAAAQTTGTAGLTGTAGGAAPLTGTAPASSIVAPVASPVSSPLAPATLSSTLPAPAATPAAGGTSGH